MLFEVGSRRVAHNVYYLSLMFPSQDFRFKIKNSFVKICDYDLTEDRISCLMQLRGLCLGFLRQSLSPGCVTTDIVHIFYFRRTRGWPAIRRNCCPRQQSYTANFLQTPSLSFSSPSLPQEASQLLNSLSIRSDKIKIACNACTHIRRLCTPVQRNDQQKQAHLTAGI